jgi:hypothetical protein
MGYDSIKIFEIYAQVSRHNSDRDKEDDKLVEQLERRIKIILEDEKYNQIMVSW